MDIGERRQEKISSAIYFIFLCKIRFVDLFKCKTLLHKAAKYVLEALMNKELAKMVFKN